MIFTFTEGSVSHQAIALMKKMPVSLAKVKKTPQVLLRAGHFLPLFTKHIENVIFLAEESIF